MNSLNNVTISSFHLIIQICQSMMAEMFLDCQCYLQEDWHRCADTGRTESGRLTSGSGWAFTAESWNPDPKTDSGDQDQPTLHSASWLISVQHYMCVIWGECVCVCVWSLADVPSPQSHTAHAHTTLHTSVHRLFIQRLQRRTGY